MASQTGTFDLPEQTRWSLVRGLHAGDDEAGTRLYELCLRYWAPVHRHIRNLGHDEERARALARAFFDQLLSEGLANAGAYGRFREFLAAELADFLAARAPSTAQAPAPAGVDADADASLRHGFALEVISLSMARLRGEAAEAGRLPLFERLQRYLSAPGTAADIERDATALGVRPLYVGMAIRHLRRRFRHIVDDELARLVREPDELAAERQVLFAALEHLP